MNCVSIEASLAGYSGSDLRPETTRSIAEHLEGCPSCSAQLTLYRRVGAGLAAQAERDLEAPAGLVDAVLETAHVPPRRVLPVLPVPPEMVRVLAENKEALASAAGTAVVVAGAAWALWRIAKRRPGAEPATS
jgi:hypothetical protein